MDNGLSSHAEASSVPEAMRRLRKATFNLIAAFACRRDDSKKNRRCFDYDSLMLKVY
jgi:hypothetical protein